MAHNKARDRRASRARRHARVRRKVRGSAQRPRLVVCRTLRHIEGQLVDDDRGVTVLGVSTRVPGLSGGGEGGKVARSYAAGKLLGERAKAAGIGTVVFDRGGYRYHGRVKAFAEGAREGGLEF